MAFPKAHASAMPRVDEPTRAFSMVTPERMTRRRLKRIQGRESGESDGTGRVGLDNSIWTGPSGGGICQFGLQVAASRARPSAGQLP